LVGGLVFCFNRPKFRYFHDNSEHISLNHLGVSVAIGFAVSHHLAHTGTEFVRPMDLPEKSADDGILWKRCDCGRIQYAEAVGFVAVFGAHLSVLNDQLGREGIAVLSVN